MADLVVAELDAPAAAVAAAKRVRELGYVNVEAYTPFPLPELDEALAIPRSRVPVLAWLAGAFGASVALGIQWWTNAFDYRLDVGGRPYASWPTYVIIMFETTVLFAALTAFASVLLGSGLPRLHDPTFDLPGFERTTVDRFWIAVRDAAPDEVASLREALSSCGAVAVHELRRAE